MGVSILMATYNGERYLREQLDSILAQTQTDWKLYISDDGSSDATPAILLEYAEAYPNQITLLKYDTPSGSAENNFFRMLQTVSDDYLALCDQDDVWLPEKLEKTLDKLHALEAQYGINMPLLVHANLKVVDQELNVLHPSFFEFQNISPERTELRNYLVQNNVTGCTMMVNRALLEKLDYIPPICTMHDWWLALIACCFGKIDYLNEPMMLYRQHQNNQVGAKDAHSVEFITQKLKNRKTVQENYLKMFAQTTSFLEHYRPELSDSQKEVLEGFLKIPTLSRIGKARQIIRYGFYKNSFLRTFGQFFSI